MEETVVAVGVVAEATAWWFVSARGSEVWRVVTPVLVALAVAAFVFGPPVWSSEASSLAAALVLSVGVTVTAEEVFWRGFAQPELARTFEPSVGAVVAWAAFVAANAPSRNLAVLASAVVGGLVWSALGWWSGGALAPLGCHVVWTGLMLSFPVVSREAVSW